jgi:hypothetical protein
MTHHKSGDIDTRFMPVKLFPYVCTKTCILSRKLHYILFILHFCSLLYICVPHAEKWHLHWFTFCAFLTTFLTIINAVHLSKHALIASCTDLHRDPVGWIRYGSGSWFRESYSFFLNAFIVSTKSKSGS